ncbi:MAG: Acyl-CoA dehydrogenase [Turneriella sp.]|nr:Acyl-CoA dehydrogenase [Turneriella sp.]
MPKKSTSTLDGVVTGAAKWGLRAMGAFAGSEFVQKTGFTGAAREALYQATRTVMGVGKGVMDTTKEVAKLVPKERLELPTKPNDLFDLNFTEEQTMVADAMAEFGEGVLRPTGRTVDDGEGLNESFFTKVMETGILGVTIPESMGGAAYERNPVTVALIAEKLGYGDYALALRILSSISFINLLNDYGSDTQRAAYVPLFAGDKYFQGTFAIMEPRLRFDIRAMQTTAERSHSGYWLNGEKCMVVAGKTADVLLVFAHLTGVGVKPFILPSDTHGVSFEEESNMGLRAAGLSTLKLTNVHLPKESLLGESETRFNLAKFIDSSKIALGALTQGTMKAAIDYAITYCNQRVAFGEPITNRQAVAFMLADMATECEALRLMVYRAACLLEQGKDAHREAYLADFFSAKYSMRIATDAVQLLGGHGYTREHPVEMYYRHLRASAILRGAICL